jgi:hypothetical protein
VTDHAAHTGGPEELLARRGNAAPLPHTPHIAFHPIIDLETGTAVAVSAPAPGRSGVESDVDRAILAAHATSRRETLLPLYLFLRARTIADERGMDRLHQTLMSLGRRPGGVIISVSGLFGGMSPADAGAWLARLRRVG